MTRLLDQSEWPTFFRHVKPCASDWNALEGKLRLVESYLKTDSRKLLAREGLEMYFNKDQGVPQHMRARVAAAWKESDRLLRFQTRRIPSKRSAQHQLPLNDLRANRQIKGDTRPRQLDPALTVEHLSDPGDAMWILADSPILRSEESGKRPTHDEFGPIQYCSDNPMDCRYKVRALRIVERED